MATIAVIAMGEMGSGVAGRLVERGARVITAVEGRSAASTKRAKSVGVEIVTEAELVSQAEVVLSIVPPAAARETADRLLGLITAANASPTYIDCNAIAPQTLHMLARRFVELGLPFGDASIIGLAPRPGYSPKFFMSGAIAAQADVLQAHGLETRVISDKVGDASALKMAYAGITKGLQAIGISMVLGADRAGASNAFIAELKDTQPELHAWLRKMLPSAYAKAHRWDDEMREIAAFLEPERGAADMLTGAATLYRHVAEENKIGAHSEMLTILNRFVAES